MRCVYDLVLRHQSIRKIKDRPVKDKEEDFHKPLRTFHFALNSASKRQIGVFVTQDRRIKMRRPDWSEGVTTVYKQVYFHKARSILKLQGFENAK